MTSLFFYGTLRHVPLLEIVLGRAASGIDWQDSTLQGYAVHSVAEGPFPGIAKDAQGVAHGVLVQGLSAQDIARLDYYEGGFDYDLVPVTLSGGQAAQVYLPAPGAWTLKGPWSLTDWTRDWGEMSCHAAREVMGYYGRKPRQEIAAMFPMIRSRATARVHARHSSHGAGTLDGKVEITDTRRVYANFFALDEYDLRHEKFDGSMTRPLTRAVFVATDAAIVLPYDPARDRVLLVEQIRMGPLGRGDPHLWQMEPIAGRLDAGEAPQDAARREAMEEAGLTLTEVIPVAETYASPGTSTEFYYVYVGLCDLPDAVTGVGGVEGEAENIRSHLMTVDALLALCDAREAANAPLVMAAYWLARHREALRAKS